MAGWMRRGLLAGAMAMLMAAPACAQGDQPLMIDRGDTGFLLICAALVLFMTLPGWRCSTAGWSAPKNSCRC